MMVDRSAVTLVPPPRSTSSSLSDALVTLPTSPPPVTTVSPRLIAASISPRFLIVARCGRMIRKYMITKIRTNGKMLISISGLPPIPCAYAGVTNIECS